MRKHRIGEERVTADGWLKRYARENRKNQTKAEEIFEKLLNSLNIRFSKQFPLSFIHNGERKNYIVDFKHSRTIYEIDGGYHNTNEQIVKDNDRTLVMLKNGYRVIRIPNEMLENSNFDVLYDYLDTKFLRINKIVYADFLRSENGGFKPIIMTN